VNRLILYLLGKNTKRKRKYNLKDMIGQITPENRPDPLEDDGPRGKEVW
jgi:antitoxin component of MazEF toxin-antitoxin module